jgi:hypothetical protein
MTHADEILRAVASLTRSDGVFTREEIRQVLNIERNRWHASYSPTFQAMRADQPGGAPSIGERYRGVFQRVAHGQHTLTEYGRQLLRELGY